MRWMNECDRGCDQGRRFIGGEIARKFAAGATVAATGKNHLSRTEQNST